MRNGSGSPVRNGCPVSMSSMRMRGFVDHGKLGDARRKIDPVSHLDEIAETVGGIDHEGFPPFPLQDQDGADIGVGQFQGPLQGDRKEVLAVEGDVAEIGEFLQGGELRGPRS